MKSTLPFSNPQSALTSPPLMNRKPVINVSTESLETMKRQPVLMSPLHSASPWKLLTEVNETESTVQDQKSIMSVTGLFKKTTSYESKTTTSCERVP